MIMNEYGWQILVSIITMMGSANAFFIVRLIKKIEESAEASKEVKKDLSHLSEKVKELTDLSARMFILEKQLAVLEYVVKTPNVVARNDSSN